MALIKNVKHLLQSCLASPGEKAGMVIEALKSFERLDINGVWMIASVCCNRFAMEIFVRNPGHLATL